MEEDAAATTTATAPPKTNAYDRLFKEAGRRRARQARRAKTSRFTFRPTLVSSLGGSGNVQIERIVDDECDSTVDADPTTVAGDRLFRQAEKARAKRDAREQERIRKETAGCTFKPTLVTGKHRPTRMSEPQSHPQMFRRRVVRIFAKIDTSGDGQIDLKEFKSAMRDVPELSEMIAPSKWKKAYLAMRAEASGDGVSLDEFLTFCQGAASLRHYDTFERRCRFIFEAIDRDGSGRINAKELKRAIIDVPELSELLSRRAFTKKAMRELTGGSSSSEVESGKGGGGGAGGPAAGGGATFPRFLAFCKKGASLDAYKGNSPVRSSERMQRAATIQLHRKDLAHEAHIRKRAAEIDAECTFVPTMQTRSYRPPPVARQQRNSVNADDGANPSSAEQDGSTSPISAENNATTTATTTTAAIATAAKAAPRGFGARMYENAKLNAKSRKEKAQQARIRQQIQELELCSFAPRVNRGPKPTGAMEEYMKSGMLLVDPKPPSDPATTNSASPVSSRAARAARATRRLYAAAQAKQKRISDREKKRIRMEGNDCTFKPEITEMGRDSRGTRVRRAPRDMPAGDRLFQAAALRRKEKDEIHEYDAGMAGMEDEFTFRPEISPRSERINKQARKKAGIADDVEFSERLYTCGIEQLARRLAQSRRPLFTFSPKITKRGETAPFFHAGTNVRVPQNNFGLPSENKSLPKAQRIHWMCKRTPVPRSPVSHALRMYKQGLKKMQERDQAFLRREMDKDFTSCTFTPNINISGAAARSTSLPTLNSEGGGSSSNSGGTGSENEARTTNPAVMTRDASTQVGMAMLVAAHNSATRLQSFGRTLNARKTYAHKRHSVTQIQKVLRGKQHRTKAQQIRQKRKQAREKVVQEQIRLREAEAKQRSDERRAKEEVENKKLRRVEETEAIIAKAKESRRETLETKASSPSAEKDVAPSIREDKAGRSNAGTMGDAATRPAEETKAAETKTEEPDAAIAADATAASDTKMSPLPNPTHSQPLSSPAATAPLESRGETKIGDSEIRVRQRELTAAHKLIGNAYAACIQFRRDSKDPPDADLGGWGVPEASAADCIPFPDWFQEVFMPAEAEQGILTAQTLLADTKQQVRKLHQDSRRVYWFGILLGWLPSTQETPFSNDASDALLEVLTKSAVTDAELLCQRPCLVKEEPIVRALKENFANTENGENEEVLKMFKTIANQYTFQKLVDLDKAVDAFLTTWYSLIGRFKAAWADDAPPITASPPNSPGGPG